MRRQKLTCRSYSFNGLFLLTALLMPTWAFAVPFNSGSTGADGAFAPTANMVLTVPPSGVFNFTTVNIPTGVTVTFLPNAANTPVTMLASGNVAINGTISLNGIDGTTVDATVITAGVAGGAGGSGGYAGGAGGLAPPWNGGVYLLSGQGLGPGSASPTGIGLPFTCFGAAFGTAICSGNGTGYALTYGTAVLLPLIGGSGGTGGPASGSITTTACPNGCNGGGGGGGGGAILIASSGTISVEGNLTADGGNGGDGYYPGGPGSGGGIRLIANTISGTGIISAAGGGPNRIGAYGGGGRIRLEANTLSFSGSFPGTIAAPFTISTPGIVNFSPVPALSITSVDGVAIPSTASGSFASPDVTLPSSTNASSVSVAVAASNVPVGTIVSVTITGRDSAPRSYDSTALSGTQASSTATAMIALSNAMTSVIRVEATFAVQTASNDFPTFAEGEKVREIRVASLLGGKSSVFLVTESGKEIPWE